MMNPTATPPAWAASAADRLRRLVERLPTEPPSFVLARLLDRMLLARLPDDARAALGGRTVEVAVSDLGLRVRLQGFPDRLGGDQFGHLQER